MRTPLAALLMLAATVAQAGPPHDPTQDPKVQKALAGRVAGKPVSCINLTMVDDRQTFDSGALLYWTKGRGTAYLNAPDCPNLRADRGTVSHTPSSQLCSGDILDVVDFTSRIPYGACGLAQFVPYNKPPKPKAAH